MPLARRPHGSPRLRARTLLRMVLILVAVYAAAATWLWMRTPTVAFDAVQRMQELSVQAQPGQDAWSVYKLGLGWTHPAFGEGIDSNRATHMLDGIDSSPGSTEWAAVVPLLDSHRTELAALKRAAAMPALGFVPRLQRTPEDLEFIGYRGPPPPPPPPSEFPALAILLPHLAELRTASRLLRAEALHQAQLGHGSESVDAIAAMMGVARHCSQVPVLVGSLVDFAVVTSAANTAVAALALKPDAFKGADLQRLSLLMAAVTPEYTRVKLGGERLMMDDTLQRLFTDDGHGGGGFVTSRGGLAIDLTELVATADPQSGYAHAPGSGVLSFVAGPVIACIVKDRAEIRRVWSSVLDETEAQSVLPMWKQEFAAENELEQSFADQRLAYFPVSVLAPAVSSAARGAALTRVGPAAVRVHVALELFHRANSRWPATLDEMVPKYLAVLPRDECMDAPLHYDVKDGVPRVWSVGRNGRDDGGVSTTGGRGFSNSADPDDLLFGR